MTQLCLRRCRRGDCDLGRRGCLAVYAHESRGSCRTLAATKRPRRSGRRCTTQSTRTLPSSRSVATRTVFLNGENKRYPLFYNHPDREPFLAEYWREWEARDRLSYLGRYLLQVKRDVLLSE